VEPIKCDAAGTVGCVNGGPGSEINQEGGGRQSNIRTKYRLRHYCESNQTAG
jgi:hypothetical protein